MTRCLLAATALLLLLAAPATAAAPGTDDVTVVAVIDSGVNPYHWDLSAEHLPQHLDKSKKNDLPLGEGAWLAGVRDAFDSFEPLPLTLAPNDGEALATGL